MARRSKRSATVHHPWLLLLLLLFAAGSTAATKQTGTPDKEMLRMMDFLKDWEVINNMDMMKDMQQVTPQTQPSSRATTRAPAPARKNEAAK